MSDLDDQILGATPESMSEAQLEELVKVLKERCHFYESENAVMEQILENLKMPVDDISAIATETESMLTSADEKLADPIIMRQQEAYLSKVKACLKHYTALNEAVTQTIAELKSQLEATKTSPDVARDYSQNILVLQEKFKVYEKEFHKLQGKNPFLANPEYNLLEIEKEVNVLRELKEEAEQLLKELQVFSDLKPSIAEAKQQLKELKAECKAI